MLNLEREIAKKEVKISSGKGNNKRRNQQRVILADVEKMFWSFSA